MDVKTGVVRNKANASSIAPVDEHRIASIVAESVSLMKLCDAIDAITCREGEDLGIHFPLYGGIYKPAYLFMTERKTR